jgi:aerotaxis receptor
MGQPHNVIRHPHMPPEAFANLWDTLEGRQS